MTSRTWIAGATLVLLMGLPGLAQARPEEAPRAFSALKGAEIERLVAAGSRVLLLISVTSPAARDAAFYEALGRPDLAAATRARAVTRATLAIGGGLILLGGAGWWTAANFDSAIGEVADTVVRPIHCPSSDSLPREYQDPACIRPPRDRFDLPLVAVAAGSMMLLSAIVLPADPVPAAEKLRLLQEHGSKRATTSDRKLAVSFNATPLSPAGGGVLVSGRF